MEKDVYWPTRESSQTKYAVQRSYAFDLQTLNFCLYGRHAVQILDVTELKKTGSTTNTESELPREKKVTAASNKLQLTNAIRSFPDEVQLCVSSIPGAGYGVCAKETIPVGTWIGPYEGRITQPQDLSPDMDTSHLWEIFKDNTLSHYLDGSDEESSSWMRFIRCARQMREQNLFAFQYCGNIFYRAFKEIDPGSELLVWYDEKYPSFLGIPLCMQDYESFRESAHSWKSPGLVSQSQSLGTSHHGSNENVHQNYGFQGPWETDGKGNFKQPLTPSVQTGPVFTSISNYEHLNPHLHASLNSNNTKLGSRRFKMRSISLDARESSSSPSERASRHYMPKVSQDMTKERQTLTNQGHTLHLRQTLTARHYELRSEWKNVESTEETRSTSAVNREQFLPNRSLAAQTETPIHVHHEPRQVTTIESAVKYHQTGRGLEMLASPRVSYSPSHVTKDLSAQYSHPFETPTSGTVPDEFSMWRCKQCYKTFTQRVLLQLHICPKTPHKPYQCGHCTLSFATPSDLRNHVETHTSDKPFKCGFCSRSFSGPTTLNNHIRTHTGERPFNCDKCGMTFSQASHLARHQRDCLIQPKKDLA